LALIRLPDTVAFLGTSLAATLLGVALFFAAIFMLAGALYIPFFTASSFEVMMVDVGLQPIAKKNNRSKGSICFKRLCFII
jgi:hypothetical protein